MTLRTKQAVPMKYLGLHDIVIPEGQPVAPCEDGPGEFAVQSIIYFLRYGTPAYVAATEHGIRVSADVVGESALTRRIELAESVEQATMAYLVELGWTQRDQFPSVTKDYQTAVGLRTATVRLDDYGPKHDTLKLTGLYESEGHNVLSTTWAYIPLTASAELIRQMVDKFVAQAEAEIAKSYAVRLYAIGVRPGKNHETSEKFLRATDLSHHLVQHTLY